MLTKAGKKLPEQRKRAEFPLDKDNTEKSRELEGVGGSLRDLDGMYPTEKAGCIGIGFQEH